MDWRGTICAFLILTSAGTSHAVETRFKIRITNTDVAGALQALANQAHSPLIFPFAEAKSFHSLPLRGRYTLKEALAKILEGTNLQCIQSPSGVIVIKVPDSSIDPTARTCFNRNNVASISNIPPTAQVRAKIVEQRYLLDEIVTTALKREVDLQDTPISVSSIPGAVLERLASPEVSRVASIAPNISFSSAGTVSGSSSAAVVYIRGIGQSDYTPVTDPGVGIYVDNVYYGRTVGAALDLMDIKSIEVVRGPQGTLFGRNTIGGAVSITTNDPSDKASIQARMTSGSYNRAELFLGLNLPISDRVTTSLNVMRRKRDGYVERVALKEADALGDDNTLSARFKLHWRTSEKLEIKFAADFLREREQSAPEVNFVIRDDREVPRAWNAGLGISTAEGCVEGNPSVGNNCFNSSLNSGPFETYETSLSRNDLDTWGLAATGFYAFSNYISSKLILSYREIDGKFARQVDGTQLNLFENREAYQQNQISADFRLEGTSARFDWTAGLFAFREKSDNQLDFGGVLNTVVWPSHYGGLVKNSNYAIYGETVFHVTHRLRLTGGLRITSETKQASPNVFSYIGGDIDNPPQGGSAGTQYLITPGVRKNSFSNMTWRAIAAYDWSDQVSLYTSVATGFKSGGFEWRITTDFTDRELPQFAPETVTTYEMGLKSYFRETGLRFNMSSFYSDYANIQVASNLPGLIATQQQNAAKAIIQGFEVEALWQPTNSIILGASVGHIDAAYKEFDPAVDVILDLNDQFVLTPRWSLSWGASFEVWRSSTGVMSLQFDGTHKSAYQLEAANSDFAFENGYVAWNAGLLYRNLKAGWGLSFGVDNLSGELYIIGGDANSTIGYENVIYARPRNWYLTLDLKW